MSLTTSGMPERAAELRNSRVPFVHARVVLAEKPTSAKPGDEALILPDGTMEGFVGGSCAESTVRAQALALLDSGEPLLLRISPVPEPEESGKLVVHNPCLSGGTLEIFLEPQIPAPALVVSGESPIARALARIASAAGFTVQSAADTPDLTGAAAVVVATHGRDEEIVLQRAMDAGVPYVGLVASRKRGEAVVAMLDASCCARGRIRTPAGLDIGARSADEVAISILAEIVEARPRPSGRPQDPDGEAEAPTTAIDPVCGMSVAMVDSSLHLDHGDGRSWFCGSGCLRAFADSPESYA